MAHLYCREKRGLLAKLDKQAPLDTKTSNGVDKLYDLTPEEIAIVMGKG